MVVQLIYISSIIGIDVIGDDKFMEGVRARNASRGITSVMLVTDSCYVHCIEGERDVVSSLFIKIAQDPRHTNQTILRFSEVQKREFGDFFAAISKLSEFNVSNNYNTVCPAMQVDPLSITSAKAMSLLRRVAAHHRANQIDQNLTD